MSYHSQFGEDQWIQENLNPPDAALFFEVGAFDGVQSSNTLHFEEDKSWGGLLIEPNLAVWGMCRQNRKSISLNFAIGSKRDYQKFYVPLSDEGRGSLSPIPSTCRISLVPVTRLDQIWACFFDIRPYLLSIDTEGTELEVWSTRGILDPTIVIIEYLQWGSDEKKQPICHQLDQDGYKVVRCTEANLIFVKK